MSILIKGMEMPTKCIECRLMRRCGKDDLDYVCMPARVYVEDLTNAYKPRPEYCPLIPINGKECPTIIPAEEGET